MLQESLNRIFSTIDYKSLRADGAYDKMWSAFDDELQHVRKLIFSASKCVRLVNSEKMEGAAAARALLYERQSAARALGAKLLQYSLLLCTLKVADEKQVLLRSVLGEDSMQKDVMQLLKTARCVGARDLKTMAKRTSTDAEALTAAATDLRDNDVVDDVIDAYINVTVARLPHSYTYERELDTIETMLYSVMNKDITCASSEKKELAVLAAAPTATSNSAARIGDGGVSSDLTNQSPDEEDDE